MGRRIIQSEQDPVDASVSQADRSEMADILQNFSTSASIHGLSKITQVRYTPFRVIWILASLSCSGLLIAQIYKQVYVYNQLNKKTLLTVNYSDIQFPDVTICNHRHIDVDILHSLFSQYNHNHINPIEVKMSRARPELEIEFMRKQSEYKNTLEYYQHNYTNYTRLLNRVFSRTTIWSALNITFEGKNTLVSPVEELLTVCHWGNKKCPLWITKALYDNYFRKCITLWQPEDNIQEGIENGLSVISLVGSGMLPFSNFYYGPQIPGLSENGHPLEGAEGLRVVVHQWETPALPMSEGFTIPPGYMGSLGIKVNRYRRMGAPYGDCTNTDPYAYDPRQPYRLNVCLQRCIQNHTVNECGCSNPDLPAVPTDIHVSCNTLQPIPDNCQGKTPPPRCLKPFEDLDRNMNCAEGVKTRIPRQHQIMKYCGCYPACSEDTYNIRFSLGTWPSLMETNRIWAELKPKIDEFMSTLNYTDTKKQLFRDHFTLRNQYKAMQDFVKLNVYLSDAAVEETTEQEDYPLINLVANIGGLMGLWVGMSVLSLMEIVQLLLEVLTAFCKRKVVNKVTC